MSYSDNFQIKDFFKNIIDPDDEYSMNIENINQGQGEGYMCQIMFVVLNHKNSRKTINLAIKHPRLRSDGTFSNYTHPHFEREIHFYQIIWPTLKNFYEKNVKKSVDFIPNCFGVSGGDIPKIALENEKKNGFVPYDTTKTFDEEHFRKLFSTYGIFHGISMALRLKHIEEYRRITDGISNRWSSVFMDGKYVPRMLDTLAKYNTQHFNPKTESFAIEKLEMFSKIGPEMVRECLKYDESNAVVLHGDCWSNNILFKYDENGTLKDVRLLDFQFPCSGSPVYDLSYCFYSGGTGKDFDNLDHYLKIYHDSLSATLQEFNLEAEKHFSFATLKEEWKKYCLFGFAMCIWVCRLKFVDKDHIPDLTEYDGSELQPVKIPVDKEDEYKQIIRDVVLHMCKNNFF